jgi:hypothetical protein
MLRAMASLAVKSKSMCCSCAVAWLIAMGYRRVMLPCTHSTLPIGTAMSSQSQSIDIVKHPGFVLTCRIQVCSKYIFVFLKFKVMLFGFQ